MQGWRELYTHGKKRADQHAVQQRVSIGHFTSAANAALVFHAQRTIGDEVTFFFKL